MAREALGSPLGMSRGTYAAKGAPTRSIRILRGGAGQLSGIVVVAGRWTKCDSPSYYYLLW